MLFLVLLFIVVPIVELWAIIQVGQLVGVPLTIGLLLADSLLGAFLLRHQGRSAWRRFREALSSGRVPAGETADGGLVIFGGALLLTPGFVTDIFGFLLLIPPTRAIFRRVLLRRVVIVGASAAGGPAAWTVRGAQWSKGRSRPGSAPDYDVEGTAVDADRPAARSELPGGA